MFGIGLPELAIIALVAVLVFGPERLPEFARQAGRMARRIRELADAVRDDLRTELGPEYADLELRDLDPRTIVRRQIADVMQDPEPKLPRQVTNRPQAASKPPETDDDHLQVT